MSDQIVIPPSIGRVVWYYPADRGPGDQPHAALVAFVYSDRLVNLMVSDPNGVPYSKTSVTLVQDGDEGPGGGYCAWMPFQIGQAKKYAAAS